MNIYRIIPTIMVVLGLLAACGTDKDNNDSPAPVIYNQTPAASVPQDGSQQMPYPVSQNPMDQMPMDQMPVNNGQVPVADGQMPVNNGQMPVNNNQVVVDAGNYQNQPIYGNEDPYGVPYNPQAEVPFDDQFGMQVNSGYDPQSEMYYPEVDMHINALTQPYNNYIVNYNVPYLGDRYRQHRAFQNYRPSFGRVQVGHHGWNQQRHQRVRNNLNQSQQWLNRDVFNRINRNLDTMKQRNFRSRGNFEVRIRDAVQRRDHDRAVRYHDDMLNEARTRHGEGDRQGGDRRGGDSRRGDGGNNNRRGPGR